MKKKDIQKIVDDMKESLVNYWVNEVGVPMTIQLHSLAIMDDFIDKLDLS